MRICVIGVGRSGTTAIYTLLQRLMTGIQGAVDYVYEPFLWDREAINRPWSDIRGAFNAVSALSLEGMVHHQRLPLFVSDPAALEKDESPAGREAVEWVGGLLEPGATRSHLLAKMIRACGRIALLRRLAPDLRIVFIIRNPFDTINSIISRFSFYGGMYHKDDFQRFSAQVHELFDVDLLAGGRCRRAEREAQFWSFSNRFALNSLRQSAPDCVLFSYEQFVADRAGAIGRLCATLDLPFDESIVESSAEPVGSVTDGVDLTASEAECLRPYQAEYLGLLEEYGIPCSVDWGGVLARYRGPLPVQRPEDDLVGKVPAYLVNRTRDAVRRFQEMDERRRGVERQLDEALTANRRLTRLEGQSRGKAEHLEQRIGKIDQDRQKLRQNLQACRRDLEANRRDLRLCRDSHRALEWEVSRYRRLVYIKLHDAVRARFKGHKE